MHSLDKYRAAAKREAWYDDEGPNAQPNYNPFRKIRTKSRGPDEEEKQASRIRTNRSENNALDPIEDERRSKNFEDIRVPKHADTMPAASAIPASRPTTHGLMTDVDYLNQSPHPEEHEREKECSEDSGIPSGETVVAEPEHTTGKARRRKFPFIGKSSKVEGSEEEEKPRRQSSLFRKETQKFTVAQQIRATLLNSWINVLLIFVPIGIAVNYAPGVPRVAVFVINFIAIIPLAAMLSEFARGSYAVNSRSKAWWT